MAQPPQGKPVTFYECHPEDHAPAPSVRADLQSITNQQPKMCTFNTSHLLRYLSVRPVSQDPLEPELYRMPQLRPQRGSLGAAIVTIGSSTLGLNRENDFAVALVARLPQLQIRPSLITACEAK